MKLSHFVFASILLAGSAGLALAQPAPAPGGARGGRGAMRAACGADIQANCAGQTGRGMFQCLNENQAKLSAGCKAAMAAMPARGGAAPAGR